MPEPTHYDIIIIGGGHAGAEAAWASANMLAARGGRAALVTMDLTKVGAMSCNPAIGGLAKGQIVREIDALGGLMGLAADATGIQFKVLNQSKGPAVRGPRCQSDKYAYAAEVQRLLKTRDNLDLIEGVVDDIVVEGGRCRGVLVSNPAAAGKAQMALQSNAVVLTTGTFMRALMHTGSTKTEGGRVGEGSAVGISGWLKRHGFELGRLKTGTPPRLARESLDLDSLEIQPGDDEPLPFSDQTDLTTFPAMPQVHCWMTHTNREIHDAILANLDRAPMYNGDIEADCGPRYCPSIEDKVKRFEDRSSHHVFLEPESLSTNEIYCNGISTSLPADIQDVMIRKLPGCENAEVLKYGYAVEYDMVWPHQIDATCMTKRIPGLFLAGQINGTSGYEEAAGQGLVAAVNAVRFASDPERFEPWRLNRDQAYIGVMLDDLVTKTPREPYRMFTSRAEHRLLLRSDNAASRLTGLGRELGLVDDTRWRGFQAHEQAMASVREAMDQLKTDTANGADTVTKWARRPEVDATALRQKLGEHVPDRDLSRAVLTQVLADLQYSGYIERTRREHERLRAQEDQPLPVDLDYEHVSGLRKEAASTLSQYRPATVGQASRLAGVNPTDLMVVVIHMRSRDSVAS